MHLQTRRFEQGDSFALRDSSQTLQDTPEGRGISPGRMGWGKLEFCSSADFCYSGPGSHHKFRTKKKQNNKTTQSSLSAALSALENTLFCLINTQDQPMPPRTWRLRRGRAGVPDCTYHNASRGHGGPSGPALGPCGALGNVVYLWRASWRLKGGKEEQGTTVPIGPCAACSVLRGRESGVRTSPLVAAPLPGAPRA